MLHRGCDAFGNPPVAQTPIDRRGIKEGRVDRKVIYINGSLHKAIPRHLGSNIPRPSNYTLCINVYIPRVPNA